MKCWLWFYRNMMVLMTCWMLSVLIYWIVRKPWRLSFALFNNSCRSVHTPHLKWKIQPLKMLKKEDNSGKLLNVLPLAIIICNENVLKSFFLAHEEGKKYFSEPKTCHFYRHILIPTNSSFQCRLIMFLQYHT